jgi:hypothetical protein
LADRFSPICISNPVSSTPGSTCSPFFPSIISSSTIGKEINFDKPGIDKSQLYYVVLSGIFMGLAVLTKGQVSLMVFLLALGVYLLYNRFKFYFGWWTCPSFPGRRLPGDLYLVWL